VGLTTEVLPLAELEGAIQRRARHLGAHYTPQPLAERAVAGALGPLCRGLSAEGLLRLRVLDPAVGSGRFLLAALGFLDAATGRPGRFRKAIASRCLFGIDVDPAAAALARRALAEASGCEPAALEGQIAVGDSLLDDVGSLVGAEGFDAVVTNPPWISFSGRQAGALGHGARRRLAERFRSFRRWPTTHGAFLELAARLLRPGGRAALVLPLQVCHLPGYEAARAAARERCRFEPPPEPLGEGCFAGVVQPAAIVYLAAPAAAGVAAAAAAAAELEAPQPAIGNPQSAIEGAILRLMRRHQPAPPGAFRDPGVHTGNSAELLLRDEPGEGLVPIREGRCVRPFRLGPPRRWLAASTELPAGHYCRVGPPSVYLGARILVRQTASRPIAARHVEPAHFRNSILACYGVPGLDDAALVGLLNSTLLGFYHRCCQPDSGQRAFPQVKVGHLQSLPIARDADALTPLVARIEALAARGGDGGRELSEALGRLDSLVFRLYGLDAEQAGYVRAKMSGRA